MDRGHRILVVAPSVRLARTLVTWLREAKLEPIVATTFASAKEQLERGPALLISEVKLGEYNGLHLALRSHAANIPTLLLGDRDRVVEREAAQFGAAYLPSAALTFAEFLSTVGKLVDRVLNVDPTSRWDDLTPFGSLFAATPTSLH